VHIARQNPNANVEPEPGNVEPEPGTWNRNLEPKTFRIPECQQPSVSSSR
jgi:hypothetical protein